MKSKPGFIVPEELPPGRARDLLIKLRDEMKRLSGPAEIDEETSAALREVFPPADYANAFDLTRAAEMSEANLAKAIDFIKTAHTRPLSPSGPVGPIPPSVLERAKEVGLVCKVCSTWLPCQLMPGVPGELGCSCDGCTHSDDAKRRAEEWERQQRLSRMREMGATSVDIEHDAATGYQCERWTFDPEILARRRT